jgi:hypothetical protein
MELPFLLRWMNSLVHAMLSLCKDLLFHVLSHVDDTSIVNVREVCLALYEFCKQPAVWLDRVESRLGYIPEHDDAMVLFQRSLSAGRPRAWYDNYLRIHPELEKRRDVLRVSVAIVWVTVVTIAGECYLPRGVVAELPSR